MQCAHGGSHTWNFDLLVSSPKLSSQGILGPAASCQPCNSKSKRLHCVADQWCSLTQQRTVIFLLFSSFGVCVCSVCMYMQPCVHVPLLRSTLISDASFSLNLESAVSASPLPVPNVTRGYRHMSPWEAVMWVMETQIQVLLLEQQVFTEAPHSLFHFLWRDGTSPSWLS